jgi:hypothetical protein
VAGNIQVTHDVNPNNARSESSLVVNPNDPTQVVAASKKFNNIQTYDFTLATEYSTDGGLSWHESAPLSMPGFTVMTDPTLAWDDTGNVFLVGLAGHNPPTWETLGIVVYKSSDGGQTWSAPKKIHQDGSDDKQWVAGDTNPASPHHGNVYAVWDGPGGIVFARTRDHGATWIGPGSGSTPAVGAIISGSVYPEINVSDDGTIYVASIGGNEISLHRSTDGGDTFTATTPPATGISSLQVDLTYIGDFPVFPGGTFRVLTDPTACAYGKTVTVAWADYREGVSRIYFARSTDGGDSWTTGASGAPLLTGPLRSDLQHFHPQIITDSRGTIGCSFYEFGPKPTAYLIDVLLAQSFDGGASFDRLTVTDRPWDPAVAAPWSHGDSALTFIGDYFGLDAGPKGFHPLWTDTRTGMQELFTAIVPERRCEFVVNRSTIGQDEVDARRRLHGPNAIVADAFRVVVDGYAAAEIGVAGPSSTLTVASPISGMQIKCTGNIPATGGYGPEVQRFTFDYELDFGANPSDPAFGFSGPTEFVTLSAAVADVSASAEIELIKQPNPFILHGDPPWLSIDLRVFTVRPGEVKFGHQMGSGAPVAPEFIQRVAKDLTTGGGTAGGQSFDDPAVLPPDEEHSSLHLQPSDENGHPVFNFALARVRYVGLIGATDVRVFFRMFQAQTTSAVYDYPPGERYRRATSNPDGQPIPLAGIQGDEYVTIPFFALPRVDVTAVGMEQQTDSREVGGVRLGNVQRIEAHPDGSEVETYFGCWLDINQPFSAVLPARRDALHPSGPFLDPTNPPLSIQQSILRNLHQCLIAEVSFDPVAIPLGKDPSNWDKLAQRNLAWSDVGSATACTTFEIQPTPAGLQSGQQPDELMIDWGDTPKDSVASLYLPAIEADEILDMASRMYAAHRLTRSDNHTLRCPTQGVTYIPVPARAGADLAGLLTVEPPQGIRPGEQFTVVVRQVTNAHSAKLRQKEVRHPTEAEEKRRRVEEVPDSAMGRTEYRYSEWRRVLGAFQLTIPVRTKDSLLFREERQLSLMRWIAEAIPIDSRWHPVVGRYIAVLGSRVRAFGGEPRRVLPSPFGEPESRKKHAPRVDDAEHDPDHDPECTERSGKIAALVFDRFGDFEGFVLETKDGEHRYLSREREVETLAERAWQERLRVSVYAEAKDPSRVASMVLRPATPLPESP